jgi:hypothetical protein
MYFQSPVNILSEQQGRARQLGLPHDGVLAGVGDEFIADLQLHGTFAEYSKPLLPQVARQTLSFASSRAASI